MSHHEANELRRRARRLRALASQIESSPIMSLDRHAGPDTWCGRRPLFCMNLLRRDQAHLRSEVDDLRTHARHFDQRAARLDRAASLQPGGAR